MKLLALVLASISLGEAMQGHSDLMFGFGIASIAIGILALTVAVEDRP